MVFSIYLNRRVFVMCSLQHGVLQMSAHNIWHPGEEEDEEEEEEKKTTKKKTRRQFISAEKLSYVELWLRRIHINIIHCLHRG